MTLTISGNTGGHTTLSVTGATDRVVSGSVYSESYTGTEEAAIADGATVSIGSISQSISRIATVDDPRFVSLVFGASSDTQLNITTTYTVNSFHRFRYRAAGTTVDFYSAEDTSGLYAEHGLDITNLTAGTNYNVWPQTSDDGGATWFDASASSFYGTTTGVSANTRYVITSPAAGSTLAVGDTVTWTDTGTLVNPNDTADLALFDSTGTRYDQGVSTNAGSYVLTDVPSGDLTIQILEVLQPTGGTVTTGEESLYTGYSGPAATVSAGQLSNVLPIDNLPLMAYGAWDDADWQTTFPTTTFQYATGNSNMSVVDDNGVRKLRQAHIPSSSGTLNTISAMRFQSNDAGTWKNIKVRQRIGLADDFTFGTTSFGGKFGMFIGGGVNTAGGLTDGSGTTLRPAFAHDYSTGKNYVSMYDYAADRNGTSGTYGDNIYSDFEIFAGSEFLLEYEAQMNTTWGSSDGWYKLWIDGVLKLHEENIGWMTVARLSDTEPKWNRIGRSEKHGGNSSDRSPTSDTHIDNWDISWEGSN